MTLTLTLASEAVGEKTWWNPYLKGALVALLAIGLFVGAAYLLLYTNVGSRLGFLLTAAAFSGFIAVLSIFWITGQFPNGPLGPAASWPVEEVVADLDEARFPEVRAMDPEADAAGPEVAGQFRSDSEVELTDNDGRFDLFAQPADFITVQTVSTGGGRKWPFWWSEQTTFAAMEICPAAEQQVLPLEAPPTPTCAEGGGTQWVVSVKDLGGRRLPSFLFFGGASILFALSLVALSRYEREVEGLGSSGGGEPGEGPGASGSGDGDAPSGDGEDAPSEPEPATT